MENTFAKLFDVNDYQVLVTKHLDSTKEIYFLNFRTQIKNQLHKISFGFDTEAEINAEYNDYGITDAIIFRSTIEKACAIKFL